MINYTTIATYIADNPDATKFTVFRVSDGRIFNVKEVRAETVILNTDVTLEIPKSTTQFKVHPSTFGLDYEEAKLKRFVPSELDKPMISVDFRKELGSLMGRLQPKITWRFGRLLKEEYYPFLPDLRTVNYDDLILKITYDYEFSPINNEPEYRLETLTLFNEMGEVYATKPQPKLYQGSQGTEETRIRRQNIISYIKSVLQKMASAGGASAAAAIDSFIFEIKDMVNLYEQYGAYALVDYIRNDTTTPILQGTIPNTDIKVKDWAVAELDFLAAEAAFPDIYLGSLL